MKDKINTFICRVFGHQYYFLDWFDGTPVFSHNNICFRCGGNL